jgi:DNA-binding GntR family transcriptional regulator
MCQMVDTEKPADKRFAAGATPKDLWQSIQDLIRNAILAGELSPGSRLVESELAEEFGTSRGPVRTALKELERLGLVVHVPRRGTFVRSVSDEDVEDILSLWDLIYPFAVRRAVVRMTEEGLGILRELIPAPPKKLTIGELMESSLAFHRALFQMAQHQRLLEIWDNLTTQTQHRLVVATTAQKRQSMGTSPIPEIYEALERRDAEAAIRVSTVWSDRMRQVLGGGEKSSAPAPSRRATAGAKG